MGKKLFNFVIGNPPYQEETKSDSTRMPPVYDKFMDAAYEVGEKVELIHPARFLFNAGYTPKTWNEKMLNDPHFKILEYEVDGSKFFPNTDIKGGICISYHDSEKEFDPIVIFTKFEELNSILLKVKGITDCWLPTIMESALNYNVSDIFKQEHPELPDRLRTNAFEALRSVFYKNKPVNDDYEYIEMFGLLNGRRTTRFIRRDYIREIKHSLDKWKVFLPASNGSGALGEVLSTPLVGQPLVGHTQSFIGIGAFDTQVEAENCMKYVKSKFARTMLGILKITQHNPPEKWRYVPLQDFTENSDIDWSKSVHEIDLQLYRKYGLDEKEIEFIETHVKEMA